MRDTILFFYPDARARKYMPPYAFLYLERVIRDLPVRVVIIDERLCPEWEEEIRKIAPNVLLAGISVMLGNQVERAKTVSCILKKHGGFPVLWGGWFPTWQPEVCVKEDYVDYVILGQGERPFAELVRRMVAFTLQQNPLEVSDIGGLGYKQLQLPVINKNLSYCHFSEYPAVNFDLVDIRQYVDRSGDGRAVFHYFASAGCPNRCNFCFLPKGWKGNWFPKSPEVVLDEIAYIFSKVPEINYLIFEDLNFFVDREFVLNICKGLIARGIITQWCAAAHVSHFLKTFSPEDITLIKQSGCHTVYCGGESGDQRILDKLNKNLLLNETVRLDTLLAKHDIVFSLSFMVLFPHQPDRDLHATLRFVMKLMRINKNLLFIMTSYMPTMRNAYYASAVEQGFNIPETVDGFIDMVQGRLSIPWHTPRHHRMMKYYGMFYFRFFKPKHIKNMVGWKKVTEKLIYYTFGISIYLRFLFGITAFPLAGWLYCNVFRRKDKVVGFVTAQYEETVVFQLQNL